MNHPAEPIAPVAIVGGGLSGLYAAMLLERRGVRGCVLFEARDTLGGRLASFDGFDLGATWFWPALQPEVARVVRELGLQSFEQHETGDMLVEDSRLRAPTRVPGYLSSPPAERIEGGMGALVAAMRRTLSSTQVLCGHRVRRLEHGPDGVALEVEGADGAVATHRAAHVLLAVPPRLAAAIELTPPLPNELARAWQRTATWMAPHAKYVAIYDAPFWRARGLSGEARSMIGPLGEIHDASGPTDGAALFGFLGLPAQTRRSMSEDELRARCRAQLVRLFGEEAARPKADLVKDWAREPYTATDADQLGAAHHAAAPSARSESGAWRDRLTGIASEWSPRFAGYIAGALDAAARGVAALE